jgi:hypothetical protein
MYELARIVEAMNANNILTRKALPLPRPRRRWEKTQRKTLWR